MDLLKDIPICISLILAPIRQAVDEESSSFNNPIGCPSFRLLYLVRPCWKEQCHDGLAILARDEDVNEKMYSVALGC